MSEFKPGDRFKLIRFYVTTYNGETGELISRGTNSENGWTAHLDSGRGIYVYEDEIEPVDVAGWDANGSQV